MTPSSKMFAQKLRSYDSPSPSSVGADGACPRAEEGESGGWCGVSWFADAPSELLGCSVSCACEDAENEPDELIVGDSADEDVLLFDDEKDADFIFRRRWV